MENNASAKKTKHFVVNVTIQSEDQKRTRTVVRSFATIEEAQKFANAYTPKDQTMKVANVVITDSQPLVKETSLEQVLKSLKDLHNKVDRLFAKQAQKELALVGNGTVVYTSKRINGFDDNGHCLYEAVRSFMPEKADLFLNKDKFSDLVENFPEYSVVMLSEGVVIEHHLIDSPHILVLQVVDLINRFHALKLHLVNCPMAARVSTNDATIMNEAILGIATGKYLDFKTLVETCQKSAHNLVCVFADDTVIFPFSCVSNQSFLLTSGKIFLINKMIPRFWCLNVLDKNFENRPYLLSEIAHKYNFEISGKIYGQQINPVVHLTLPNHCGVSHAYNLTQEWIEPTHNLSPQLLETLIGIYCVPSAFKNYGITIPDIVYRASDLESLSRNLNSSLTVWEPESNNSCTYSGGTTRNFLLVINASQDHLLNLSSAEAPFVSNGRLNTSTLALAGRPRKSESQSQKQMLKDAEFAFSKDIDSYTVERFETAINVFRTVANPIEAMGKAARIPDGLGGKVALLDQILVRDVNFQNLDASATPVTSVFGLMHLGHPLCNVMQICPQQVGSSYLILNLTGTAGSGGLSHPADQGAIWDYFPKPDTISSLLSTVAGTIYPIGSAWSVNSVGQYSLKTFSAFYRNGKKDRFASTTIPVQYPNSGDTDAAIPIQPGDTVTFEIELINPGVGVTITPVVNYSNSGGVISSSTIGSIVTVAAQSMYFIATSVPASMYGVVSFTCSASPSAIYVAGMRLRVTPVGGAFNQSFPFGEWAGNTIQDAAVLQTGIASSYRNTANSILLSDGTPSLYQAGFVSACQNFAYSPPGESGIISPQSVAQAPYGVNHLAREGVYSAPFNFAGVSSHAFKSLDCPYDFTLPYTIIAGTLPYNVGYIMRYIAVSIYELKLDATRLIETRTEPSDKEIMEVLERIFEDKVILGTNGFHWGSIGNFFKDFGKQAVRVIPQIAPLVSDVLMVMGKPQAAGAVNFAGRGFEALRSIVDPDEGKLAEHGVAIPQAPDFSAGTD